MSEKKVKVEGEEVKGNVEEVHELLHKRMAEMDKHDNDVYQPTYDDFLEWCYRDRKDYPSLFFREYVKLHNCFDASNSEIVKCALSNAMHECWVAWFDKAKNYLTDFVGTKKPERKEPTAFGSGMGKNGYLDFLRRRAADIAADKKGGAK